MLATTDPTFIIFPILVVIVLAGIAFYHLP